jgi:hypothetical protein
VIPVRNMLRGTPHNLDAPFDALGYRQRRHSRWLLSLVSSVFRFLP